MSAESCPAFLQGDAQPGSPNLPCKYVFVFPARIALSSEKKPPFDQGKALNIEEADFPATLQQYRYTLRSLREGYLYLLEKAGTDVARFAVNENGMVGGRPWIKINQQVTQFWVAFSDFVWSDDFRKKVSASPAAHMRQVSLVAGQPYVGAHARIPELVEEYRAAPGHLMSLRGHPDVAKSLCDSEDTYLADQYAPPDAAPVSTKRLLRRWHDGHYRFAWKYPQNPDGPQPPGTTEKKCPLGFLLAVHDAVGVARELAELHTVSMATLSSRDNWFAYPESIGKYVNQLLEGNPEYAEHLEQHYNAVEHRIVGEWNVLHRGKCPYEHLYTASSPDEKLFFFTGNVAGPPPGHPVKVWMMQRSVRRFPGAEKGKTTITLQPTQWLKPWSINDPPVPEENGNTPYLLPDKDGRLWWVRTPMSVKPAQWEVRGLQDFMTERKISSQTLRDTLKLLLADRVAWLSAAKDSSFVKALRNCDENDQDVIKEREKVYATCHTSLTLEDNGKKAAQDMYLSPEAKGEQADLFWTVTESKSNGAPLLAGEETPALIATFSFYLDNLPSPPGEASADGAAPPAAAGQQAQKLLDAWENRVLEPPQGDPPPCYLPDLLQGAFAFAKHLESEQANEDQQQARKDVEAALQKTRQTPELASAPLIQKTGEGKPFNSYVREALLSNKALDGGRRILIALVGSRTMQYSLRNIINASGGNTSYSKIRSNASAITKSLRQLEWVLHIINCARAANKNAANPTLVSNLKVLQAVASLLAVRGIRTRVREALETTFGRAVGRRMMTPISFLARGSKAGVFGFFTDMADAYSLYEKDDNDAANAVLGMMLVSFVLVTAGAGAIITIPVAIGSGIWISFLKNNEDEDWLTHCYWGEYYKKYYKNIKYPEFSYNKHFIEEEKLSDKEEEDPHPLPPKEALVEHSEQHLQWINMKSAPNVSTGVSGTYLYIKYTVALFDITTSYLQCNASLNFLYTSKSIAVDSSDGTVCVPLTPFIETSKTADGKEIASLVTWEAVFDLKKLQEKAKPHLHGMLADEEPVHLALDFTYYYTPEIPIKKPKQPLVFEIMHTLPPSEEALDFPTMRRVAELLRKQGGVRLP